MIRMRSGDVVILGIEDENVRRMKAGNPVLVKSEFGLDITGAKAFAIFHFDGADDGIQKIKKLGLDLREEDEQAIRKALSERDQAEEEKGPRGG